MAETFTGTLKIIANGTLTSSQDIGGAAYPVNYSKSYSLTNGTAANQANMMWADTRTLSGSSNEDLDLAGGVTSAFGTTITFTKLKGIIISAASTNGDNITVGGASANALSTMFADATDKLVIRPGGTIALIATDATAYAVTATTADLLNIANLDSSDASYDIILIGTV